MSVNKSDPSEPRTFQFDSLDPDTFLNAIDKIKKQLQKLYKEDILITRDSSKPGELSGKKVNNVASELSARIENPEIKNVFFNSLNTVKEIKRIEKEITELKKINDGDENLQYIRSLITDKELQKNEIISRTSALYKKLNFFLGLGYVLSFFSKRKINKELTSLKEKEKILYSKITEIEKTILQNPVAVSLQIAKVLSKIRDNTTGLSLSVNNTKYIDGKAEFKIPEDEARKEELLQILEQYKKDPEIIYGAGSQHIENVENYLGKSSEGEKEVAQLGVDYIYTCDALNKALKDLDPNLSKIDKLHILSSLQFTRFASLVESKLQNSIDNSRFDVEIQKDSDDILMKGTLYLNSRTSETSGSTSGESSDSTEPAEGNTCTVTLNITKGTYTVEFSQNEQSV